MSRSDTILAIVNVEARHHAGLAKAALLAQKYRTRLELFAVGGAALSVALDSLARPLRDQGLEVTTATIAADSLSAALAVRFRDPAPRFVVKDVSYGASSPRIELTRADWLLARTCPVPLLLSKPTLWSELPVVCAAIDSWHEDDAFGSSKGSIVAQGALVAERLDGKLHVLIGCACKALISFVTEQRASIVVLGSASRADLRGDVNGSTAEGLLKQIPCDVLVVNRSSAAATLH